MYAQSRVEVFNSRVISVDFKVVNAPGRRSLNGFKLEFNIAESVYRSGGRKVRESSSMKEKRGYVDDI